MEGLYMAKRRKKRSRRSARRTSPKDDNKMFLIVGVLAIMALVFYMASGGEPGQAEDWVEGTWKPLLAPGETATVSGQEYYGYLVQGYTVLMEVHDEVERLELLSLNDDETVDLVFNRRNYNVHVGETIMGDFDGDGKNDVALTLEGVDMPRYRFSMTLTYFSNY
jgi:hypothetical protein